jgi:hypothetical protein
LINTTQAAAGGSNSALVVHTGPLSPPVW